MQKALSDVQKTIDQMIKVSTHAKKLVLDEESD